MPATKRTKTYSLRRARVVAPSATQASTSAATAGSSSQVPAIPATAVVPDSNSTNQDSSSQAPATPVTAVVTNSQPTNPVPGISAEILQQITAAVTSSVLSTLGSSHGIPATEVIDQSVVELPLGAPQMGHSVGASVQGPLASALSHVTGEPCVPTLGSSQHSGAAQFNSMALPIDARVSAKIKAKIWANEFVDLGILLSPHQGEASYSLAINPAQNQGSPVLCLEPTTKGKAIQTIDKWMAAFQIFVAVYTSKYHCEAPALMKYAEVVRDLADRGADWQYYDTNFRLLRQEQHAGMPWDNAHWELWIRAQQFGRPNFGRPNFSRQLTHKRAQGNTFSPAAQSVPRGFCRKFHSGGACSGCSYKHQCPKCNSVHPANKCNFRPSRQPRSGTAPGASHTNPRQ